MSRHPIRRRIAFALVPFAKWIVSGYWLTLRKGPVLGSDHLDGIVARKEPVILCYWHQAHLMALPFLRQLQTRGLEIASLVSPSDDGEIAARFGKQLGVGIIRGSSSKTGAKALRDLYVEIRERRTSIALTTDGPRGPIHEFKIGAILLAQLTGTPIVPLVFVASRSWQLNSWDRFIIPKPGAGISQAIGEPMGVERKLTTDEMMELQRLFEARISKLTEESRAALG